MLKFSKSKYLLNSINENITRVRFSATNNSQQSPILSHLFENLIKKDRSGCFVVQSNQIEILNEPMEYYLALHV